LKHCFRILLFPLEYDFDVQARLPASLAVLHNFIRLHEPNPTDNEDEDDAQLEDEGDEDGGDGGAANEPAPGGSNIANATVVEEHSAASAMRDRIAQQMWDDYLVVLSGRRDLEESDDDSIDSDVYSHI
jgi:hypothetical protein